MRVPITCPSCDEILRVSEMKCEQCETIIKGKYDLPLYMHLSVEEQQFILEFFVQSGSIKEMATQFKISYPTMRNKLDDLIQKIKSLQK
jgi:hypothetical protein